MSAMSSDSKDSDALLGIRRGATVVAVRHIQQMQQQPLPQCHRPWYNVSRPGGAVNADVDTNCCHVWPSSEPPIIDPRVERTHVVVGLAPHADLIELASSTENLSLCGSTSSAEYKSCDEEDGSATAVTTSECWNLDLLPSRERECCNATTTADFVPRVLVDAEHDADHTDEAHCFLPPSAIDGELPFVKRLPQCPSAAQLSMASSNSDPTVPTCRICHLTASGGGSVGGAAGGGGGGGGDDHEDGLISPCRCSGTMQYIHSACLMKWLEVSSRKSKRPPSCELCLYQYHRHKKFKADDWKFPVCTLRDKVLHALFFLSLLTMIGSATVTILCFKHDKALGHRTAIAATATSTTSLVAGSASGAGAGAGAAFDRNRLTHSEVVTLVCGVLFFVAFFLAMYVEVKSRSTIYKLITDFLYLNQQWYIDEYDKKMDVQSMEV